MTEPPYTTSRLRRWRAREELRPSFISTLDDIEDSGWQGMLVSSEHQKRSFAYTIGLHDVFGFPELITTGLPLKVAHSALDDSVQKMHAGVELSTGRHRDIVGEVDVIFRPVSADWYRETMLRSDWYYEGAEVPALQLIYPDLKNVFQWEDGFNEYFRQPLLQSGALAGQAEHDFRSADDIEAHIRWKFPDGRHTSSFLSQTVFDKSEPVVFVSHDRDGAWQFLGDSMSDGGGPVVSCLHHAIDDDSSLEELHDLPYG